MWVGKRYRSSSGKRLRRFARTHVHHPRLEAGETLMMIVIMIMVMIMMTLMMIIMRLMMVKMTHVQHPRLEARETFNGTILIIGIMIMVMIMMMMMARTLIVHAIAFVLLIFKLGVFTLPVATQGITGKILSFR